MILHWLGIVLGCLAAAAPAEQLQSQTENSKKTSRGQAECGKFQGWVGAENHKTKCHIAKNPCDCIRANELCGWCADESFQYGRCDLPANLETLKCQDVQTVESKVYTGNADFNPEKDRIFPKDANAIIRVGDSVDLLFNVTEPRIYPAELYYLMDVSYSMRDDMERMKKMGGEIAKKLRELTNQEAMVRIGFGTFVDKVISPQTEMTPFYLEKPYRDNFEVDSPFLYKNVNPLTDDITKYTENMQNEHVSGNLDGPEGALEAMYQAVLCRDEVGWQHNTLKLLVLATESWFHSGGSGMGKLSGLIDPADDQCHLEKNEYIRGDQRDYPTIKQVVDVLEENSIIPIFAVRKGQLHHYQNATEQLFKVGSAEILEEKSKNILDLIEKAYNIITQKQHLVLNTKEFLDAKDVCLGTEAVFTDAQGVVKEFTDGEDVTGLSKNSNVQYTIRQSVHPDTYCSDTCRTTSKWGELKVRTQRYDDFLLINTTIRCNFDCMEQIEANSIKCSGNGDFACGVCLCHDLFFGSVCEFERPPCPTPGQNCTDCINPEMPTEICSGQGQCPKNFCECNQIESGIISGKWCQCSNTDCYNDGADGTKPGICSDHGQCVCDKYDGRGISKCMCDKDWTGDFCECPASQETCRADSFAEVCSGRGECKCGKCICESDDWTGPFCDTRNCGGEPCANCKTFSACIECKYHSDDKEDCDDVCPKSDNSEITYTLVGKSELVPAGDDKTAKYSSEAGQLCSAMTQAREGEPPCKFYYKYYEKDNGDIQVWAEDDPHCGIEYSLIIILWAVLAALLIGLLFLCCWRICVFCVDREKRFPTIAYLVEFIKAKYFMKRSQTVAVIPVRRSVFDGNLSIKWRTFPVSVADDDFRLIREGESGTLASSLARGDGNSVEMERLLSKTNWGQGQIEWKDGEEFADIHIDIKGPQFEGREAAFIVELIDRPEEVHFGQKRTKVIIIKDDEPGSVGFAKPSYVFKEADHSALIPIHRANGIDGRVVVSYKSRDMTAIGGQHYRQTSGEIIFEDGETSKVIEIEFFQDSIFDGREKAFNLELFDPLGGATLDCDRCMVTLLYDETVSVVQFLRQSYPFLENCQKAAVPVIRTRSTKGRSSVRYRTRDITAKAGVDYKTVEGELEFANGETEKLIEVSIIENDRYIEEGRTFGLELYEPSDGTKMELNNCEIKIIEDDDPGRFELARSNYVFKAGKEAAIIPVMRSMGADGTVKLPWVIRTQDGSSVPDEITTSGTLVFENMEIDGAIDLNVNVDREEDTNLIIELMQPTNNARLGHQRSTNVKIYGKGHFDEVELNVVNPTILRGAGMSPLIVNLERKIRLDPPQASVVLFETIDGTAKAEDHHYSAVKKAVIFDANETLQQVKIFVDDEIDDETNDDLIFTCKIIPISDSVIVTRDSQEILITNPIEAVRQQNVRGAMRNSAKISFTQEKHLCRLSEETYTLIVKRIGKEDRQASCLVHLELIEGSTLPESELIPVEVLFEPNESQKELTLPLPLMDCEQILLKHSLSDYGPNTTGGNLTETVVNVINDRHVGTVGFGVPEVTFPVADIQQKIHILRHGGTDGPLEIELSSIGDSAVNQVHYEFEDGTKVFFEDGQFQASVPITFIPGNHGKMVSRKMQLKIDSVSGMGKIGQETCSIQLLTDQAPCSISFARPEFSFMAKSGDQGLPLLRIGSLEKPAEIKWSFVDHTEILEEKGFPTSGSIEFAASKNRSFLKIPTEMLELLINKSLSVKIEPISGQAAVSLGKYPDAIIKVISGHEPGSFEFRKTRAVCRQNDGQIDLSVARQGGADGEVKVDWSASSDLEKYDGLSGEIVFAEGVHEQIIKIDIDKEMKSDTESFCVQLFKCSDGLIGARNMANISVLKESEDVEFEFETDFITTDIGAIDVAVGVIVKGELEDLVSLRYATQPDTAQPGEHYLTQSEQLVFKPNESRKVINLNLLDAPLEEPVSLTLSLLVATGPGRIGLKDSCVITIPPAGHPGQVSFTQDFLEVSQSDKIVQLPLTRSRGNRGALPVGWSVSSDNWYDRNNGQIMFDDGQSETHIDFPLNCQPSDVPIEEFTIKLHKPVGKAELGPVPSLTVRVHNDLEGGRVGFDDESSEILVHDTDVMTTVLALSDGRNRVQFDLEYQLLPVSVDQNVAAELAEAFVSTIQVPAGLQRIPIEIPISYIPSGQSQCLLVKLLKSNNGVRIGDNDQHRLTILSPKRTIGFMETKVNANQSTRELILIVKRKISNKENLTVPWIAYTSPEPLSGVLNFADGQEFDEVRIPFKQMYISGTPLVEEFDVELKPGVVYDLEDRRGKCHVTLNNDLGPGVIEFSDDSVRQLQSNGNITVRLLRHERCLEEATVKWRVDAPEGSYFRGLVGTAQFRSGDEGLDLAINVPEMPQDNSEEKFTITLDQPINASLGDKTQCSVSLLNDKTAGEIAFYDPLPKIEQQSNGRLSVCVVRTQVSDGDVTQPWRLQPFSSTHTAYKGISGELDFASGETKLWIHLDLPTEPQEFPDESFFIVLDRPKGGARLKNGEQRLEVKIENDIMDAPTNIQTEVHATQCVVMWDFQRYVREYQITYSKTSRQSVKLMKVSGDEENVVLLDLDPCSEYEIMIAAINQFGNSATSETITIMTPGLPPSKPSRLAFQLLSPTSLQVNWGEPTHCHGEITSYVVEYHTIDEHSGIPPMIVPLPGPDHRSLFVENLVENTEYRYTVRAENRWGLGEMRTARMWIKPMAGRGSRPPSTVVMGSESSLASHSTWQGEQGQYNIEVEETDNTTDAGYRSEKHKTWTTHSKGGFTTDTGNSDIDLPSDLGSPIGTFSPDIMQQHSSNQVTISGRPQQATILSEDLKMSGNKVLRTVVDVNVNPEVKKITTKKVTKQFRSDEGVLSEVEEHYRGQEEYMSHDVQSNIHKDEHVDTDVKTRQDGDTEITTITKTVTHRTVEETRETLTGGVRNLHHERSPYRVRREKQQPMESSDSE